MTFCLLLLIAGRIVITEVMSNPAGGSGARFPEDRNEYVELYNAGGEAVDMDSWIIDDGDAVDRLVAWADSSILTNNPTLVINKTWLNPGQYAVVLDSEYTDLEPLGGYVQPYDFGEGCLILTTGNTTLGNGLAVNDPMTIISSSAYGYADTSTFGTPLDPDDGFPDNPGDGFSWERLDIEGPDTPANWAISPDPAGCTPGRTNAAGSVPDLAVLSLALAAPESLTPGTNFAFLVRVGNAGFVAWSDWSLSVFLDRNGNRAPDPSEEHILTPGWSLPRGADTLLRFGLPCPQVTTDLWAIIACDADRDTANNRSRLTLNPAGPSRMLSLGTSGFSPNDDGFEDSLAIIYRLPRKGGKLTVDVYDLRGRIASSLLATKTESEQGVVHWDGRDKSGRALPRGIYAVRLEYVLPDIHRSEQLPVVLER